MARTKVRLTDKEMAFADLIAVGWDIKDAWRIAINKGLAWTPAALKAEREKLFNLGAIQDRIASTKRQLRESQIEAIAQKKNELDRRDVQKATSKEAMLTELVAAKQNMEIGSREWLDTNKMIADINRLKQDEIKTEDNTIHYYIPLQCHECPLYQNEKKST